MNVVVGKMGKFQLSFWEVGVFTTVVITFLFGLLCVYLTMPASDYSFLKLPRNLQDLQILRYYYAQAYSIFRLLLLDFDDGCGNWDVGFFVSFVLHTLFWL